MKRTNRTNKLTWRFQLVLSLVFVAVITLFVVLRPSFILASVLLSAVLFCLHSLWQHRKTQRLSRETIIEYLIVLLMVVVLIAGSL